MQPSQPNHLDRNQYLEQAKTHVDTIEQGLLNLSDAVKEPETLKQLHQAAEFLNTGAVIHQMDTIAKIAQFFEDCFSVMRTASVVSDQHLEDLLWRIFDTFQGLIDMHAMSQEPTEYIQGVEREVLKGIQETLSEAKTYLQSCVDHDTDREITSDQEWFHQQVDEQVTLMEQRLQDNPFDHRYELQQDCQVLEQLGIQAEFENWVNLLKTARKAIAGTENSVESTTKCAIAEIRQAQNLIKSGKPDQIQPSQQLKSMSLQLSSSWDTQTEEEINLDQAEDTIDEVESLFSEQDTNLAPQFEEDEQDNDTNQAFEPISNDGSDEETDWWASLDDDIWQEQDLNLETHSDVIEDSSQAQQSSKANELSPEQFDEPDLMADLENFLDEGDDQKADIEQQETDQELEQGLNESSGELWNEELSGFNLGEQHSGNDATDPINEGFDEQTELNSQADLSDEDEEQLDWENLFGELEPEQQESNQTNEESELDELLAELDQSLSASDQEPQQEPSSSNSSVDSLQELEQLFANEQEDTFTPQQEAEHDASFLDHDTEQETFAESSSTPSSPTETLPFSLEYYDDIAALASFIEVPAAVETESRVDFAALEALIDEQPSSESQSSQEPETTPSTSTTAPQQPAETKSAPTPAANRSGASLFEQTVKVPVRLMDQLNNLIGELVVNRNRLEQDQERLRRFLDNLLEQVQNLNELGARMQDLYERSLLENSLLASRSYSQVGATSSSVNETTDQDNNSDHHGNGSDNQGNGDGNGDDYDPLEMDRFSGFHLLSQEMIELIVRVRESTSDIEFLVDEVEQEARVFRQVTTQLQEGFTSARMVPFSQVADRLPRAIREISLKLNKKAKLQVEGKDTLIDKMILEQLYDPMTHLVNNAITHGLESPDARKASGKPETGTIKVEAHHQGNQTLISLSDDGAGLDPDGIRRKAVNQGLISEAEAQNLPDLDIFDFIFHPGFSTKDQADDFAGRGVGMDVVRSSLSKLRGSINIDSTPGKGTKFTIGLPLTLSISTALCCKLNQYNIAFPIDGVEDQFEMSSDQIKVNQKGERWIPWQKSSTLLPIKHLSELFAYNRTLTPSNVYTTSTDKNEIPVIILRSTGNLIALEVDQVLGQQEIVIKQLSGPIPKPIGIGGATVTSDGSVMAIADVLELIDLFYGRIRKDVMESMLVQQEEATQQQQGDSEPMVLIVDDSITVRELLSATFSNAGYRVEQARDGQEAWEKLQAGLACDMMLCDIEMPRMDGLDLLSQLQKQQQFANLPVGMLTSRGAERHREMAMQLGAKGYFTKPYLEEVLLDAAKRMLKGENLMQN